MIGDSDSGVIASPTVRASRTENDRSDFGVIVELQDTRDQAQPMLYHSEIFSKPFRNHSETIPKHPKV